MPKKSQKIAARQAQLSGHKRKTHRRGPTGVPEIDVSTSQSLEDTQKYTDSGAANTVPSRSEALKITTSAAPTAIAHKFIRAELIQIGILTVVVLSVLSVASFILS
jgi:hypothetical protein